jgi:NAD(P)-dependent dehydrogenase (short-subunit alcohol dehydrogenase family)
MRPTSSAWWPDQRLPAGPAPICPSARRERLQRHGLADLEHRGELQFDFQAAATGADAAYRSSKAALNAPTVFHAQALAADHVKVNVLAPGLWKTNLNALAATAGGDPTEAAADAVRLVLLPDDGSSGLLFSFDGTVEPW